MEVPGEPVLCVVIMRGECVFWGKKGDILDIRFFYISDYFAQLESVHVRLPAMCLSI